MSGKRRWPAWVLVVLLAGAAGGADEGQKPTPEKDPKKARERLISTGQFAGRVVAIDTSARTLTLQVTLSYLVANDGQLSVEEQQQDVPLEVAEDAKVRVRELPPNYDDKGRLRKYTAAQLRELKGPGNLPGYRAEFEDVQEGQTIRVVLAVKKTPAEPGKKAEVTPPKVALLVILAQPE